jgi:YesN/AraC family two-component response regulator
MFFPLITDEIKKLPFYLVSVGYDYKQEYIDRPNGYPHYQWLQCHKGEGELILNNQKYLIKEHQGIFLCPNIEHKYYAINSDWETDWIAFNGSHVQSFLDTFVKLNSGAYFISTYKEIRLKIKKSFTIASSSNTLNFLECSSMVYDLLIDLNMHASKNIHDSKQRKYLKLQPVLTFIEHHYNEPLTLEILSQVMEVTPQHLCLLFKKFMNTRPFEYINYVRISKCKELLIHHTHLKVSRIAKLLGYENTSYYCAVFKKLEGITPNTFRQLNSVGNECKKTKLL